MADRLRGTFAAAVTPMTGGGGSLDDDAVVDVMDFYARAGLDEIGRAHV